MNRSVLAILCGVAIAHLAGCQSAPRHTAEPTKEVAIDARADDALRSMSALLTQQHAFTLHTESVVEQVGADGQKLQFSRQSVIRVRRPDRIHAVSSGDAWNKEYAYDGRNVTLLDRSANLYSTTEIPDTIDRMFDILAERYGLSFPTCDLLYSDPFTLLRADVRIGRYVGLHAVQNIPCHHLAFSQEAVDWQIWIEASDTPWPRKLVVTYKSEPVQPQDIILFRDWQPESTMDETLFTVDIPADAMRTELMPIVQTGS